MAIGSAPRRRVIPGVKVPHKFGGQAAGVRNESEEWKDLTSHPRPRVARQRENRESRPDQTRDLESRLEDLEGRLRRTAVDLVWVDKLTSDQARLDSFADTPSNSCRPCPVSAEQVNPAGNFSNHAEM